MIERSLQQIAFPSLHYLVRDGQQLDFFYNVIDDFRGFVPPWRWPSENRFRASGIFDSNGVFHDCRGEVGYRPPPPLITLANGLALGGALFVALHGNGSYGPSILEHKQLSMDEYRSKLRDVIFNFDEDTTKFKEYVEVTDKKLNSSRDFQQMVEVVRWHVLTDGGKVELSSRDKFYGRTPTV